MRTLLLAASLLWVVPGAAEGKKPVAPQTNKTILKLFIEPPSQVFIDGVARGLSTKIRQLELSPGAHIVRIVYKKDEHEEQVILKKGEVCEYHWAFENVEPKPPAAESKEKEGSTAEDRSKQKKGIDETKAESEPADPAVEKPAPKEKEKKKDLLEGIDAIK